MVSPLGRMLGHRASLPPSPPARFATQFVHCDSQGGVRLHRNGSTVCGVYDGSADNLVPRLNRVVGDSSNILVPELHGAMRVDKTILFVGVLHVVEATWFFPQPVP